ncbi:TPR_1 domain-containing protein/TPR_9 domain-containing protein/TPR_11 domain-containing protein [Cephalotus follicularis]|uniref:TPR_1 domain-containing protein/TPR_9 domain-containing protein/TPR_11 domain-containing protein n=1 Tax=Cephalotus follicularis TaxID=3775 RepID=A0A1Q3BF81_CEPFO|nr:TPR_1 domain-containing protein/TPR_9 domain-containing protein/TPR_11 domain-containing protein [Cephalotus follicularis]
MRGFKVIDKYKGTQIHALNHPPETTNSSCKASATSNKLSSHRNKFIGLKSHKTNSVSISQTLLTYGLPTRNTIEPPIDPYLKPILLVESLADVYRRLESCSQPDKLMVCMEQYSILCALGDPKLLTRCLRSARQVAVDVHSKVVLSSWLRFERREDDIVGLSSMDCSGFILECSKAALICGYDPSSIYDHCQCSKQSTGAINVQNVVNNEYSVLEEDSDVSFCIGDEEIHCIRYKMAALSSPLKAMLYGSFVESKQDKIHFSWDGISVEGMRAVEMYSRRESLDIFCPEIVLELLCFSNRFCCEEMKCACDAHLASLVCCIEDALILIEYGLEERANLLVASCLQVLLRQLPLSLDNSQVVKFFSISETRERLAMVGHASFLLYFFLSQVAIEENMISNATEMLLERLEECATKKWQKALAMHQLGCVMLKRCEYNRAQNYFQAAAEAGHVYSLAGVARAKYKQGQQYSAYRLTNSLIFEYKPAGWMYQERSLYCLEKQKCRDLNTATELDPTLSFPYKYRAVAKLEEKQIRTAILEIEKIIAFKLSPDCIELRAWFFIALEDYESALRDIRALLTLDPHYMMFQGKVSGDLLIELLGQQFQQCSQADCWMQLYERWSSVDDIGSLAVIHQMLVNDPRNSLLRFRQSLLLLRLNCPKAALRCLRMARNHSSSDHERLVYEGWILYDTGHHAEAIAKADTSILIKRSFEAFFIKAYTLADMNLDPKSSSYVIQLLEEALTCPSDGLRKGQALNNLGSIYVDCGKLELAANCYMNALDIKHARAHQGLARVYHLRNNRKAAYDEMTKLIEKSDNKASAYEKRSEYCDREMAINDLNMATQLDPLRTYPYRYRAAVFMDDQKETEAVEELTKAITFKPDLQMLHLRAAFYESMGDLTSALQDCSAALCLDPNHTDTIDLYNRTHNQATNKQKK